MSDLTLDERHERLSRQLDRGIITQAEYLRAASALLDEQTIDGTPV